jgi:hypothetical protein
VGHKTKLLPNLCLSPCKIHNVPKDSAVAANANQTKWKLRQINLVAVFLMRLEIH